MCGINGFLDKTQKLNRDELYNIVHGMNEKITYRGPDAEGVYLHDNFCMGMRRLSIIDLSSGNQPIYNEDHTVAVVFNGEIYNYIQLRKSLEKKGHIFATSTDTEVIVHGYEECEEKIFSKLDGMFAISLYDSKKKKLLIARDRLGEKPCYYYSDSRYFIYGSELKSLLSTGFIPRTIDIKSLNLYLQLTYIPSPFTIFENVYKLEPGHYLAIDEKGYLNDNVYYDLSEKVRVNNDLSYEDAKRQLRKLLIKSVSNRMVSDVPLGAFLSGGIDSSIIVGIMSRLSDQPVNTFTIGFNEASYDERDRARQVARFNNTEHHEYLLDYSRAFDMLDNILERMDEPFADSSVLPTYFVSQSAAQDVKVVLTGDAGDELFLGYDKYLIEYYTRKYKMVPSFLRKGVIEPVIESLADKSVLSRKVNKVIKNAYEDIEDQRINMMKLGFKSSEIADLLTEDYYINESDADIKETYKTLGCDDELKRTQYTDLKIVLEGDMLTKVDRMSMLNSLETRVPLLASDVVDFSVSLPDNYKLDGKNKKKIFKDTFKDILPKNFDRYPKSGFGVPLDRWFRNEMKPDLFEVLDEKRLNSQGIFNPIYVKKILNEHETGVRNRKSEIWGLYVFEKWYDKWM